LQRAEQASSFRSFDTWQGQGHLLDRQALESVIENNCMVFEAGFESCDDIDQVLVELRLQEYVVEQAALQDGFHEGCGDCTAVA
jgi:hypothetical protein